MNFTLINHACVKIRIGNLGILCDPWLDGPVFNNGWLLLSPTPVATAEIMDGVTYIWLSHEHPDHFSPKFLFEIAKSHADKITILFQKTRDGRVKSFCEARGFRVQEIAESDLVSLGDGVTVRVGKSDFYDSWLFLDDGHTRVMNLNDCPMRAEKDIGRALKAAGHPDVLLTQFSYAAWKGGRDNKTFREEAAREKLNTVCAQIRVLQPRFVIPFASFSYFANPENFYLNDSINTPALAAQAIDHSGTTAVVLYPGDSWQAGAPHCNDSALARFSSVYANLTSLPLLPLESSVPVPILEQKFAVYRNRLYKKNSRLVIRLLRALPVFGIFYPVIVGLTDTNQVIRLSVVDGFSILPPNTASEVQMHSASLAFIFDNEFGFDTLTVNGRFEATPTGFSRMVKGFALGSLNTLGLTLSLRILRNPDVVTTLLSRLANVMKRLPNRRMEVED
ncbi:MAG TPA: MBL fold metallo-hydrolase [Edaphobacter sp.]|nr:MBL fold metallo-hydrolase [Edaphobacter sp.]